MVETNYDYAGFELTDYRPHDIDTDCTRHRIAVDFTLGGSTLYRI